MVILCLVIFLGGTYLLLFAEKKKSPIHVVRVRLGGATALSEICIAPVKPLKHFI